MKAGQLRHRIEFQERNETRGTQGSVVESWTTLAFRWARIVPLNGQELVNAQQIKNTISHRIELRYWVDLTAKLRIVFNGRTFGIESVINIDERNREHHCFCTEEVAA